MMKEYVGTLVIENSKDGRACCGLLIEANDKFIKIQFRNGRTATIAIDNVAFIAKARDQTIKGLLPAEE